MVVVTIPTFILIWLVLIFFRTGRNHGAYSRQKDVSKTLPLARSAGPKCDELQKAAGQATQLQREAEALVAQNTS